MAPRVDNLGKSRALSGIASIVKNTLRQTISRDFMRITYQTAFALLFSGTFHLIAALLFGYSFYTFFHGLGVPELDLITLIIKSINTLVIALAMFELGIGVGIEYTGAKQNENIFQNTRRTITRFVGTVCIALVLESLFMVIKYSQLDLAGNLYYPVAILIACALLLVSLGGFLALTNQSSKNLP